MTPVRIQRRRTKGWQMPENTVYVGRPTIWGNPFVHDDPAEAVAAFRKRLTDRSCTLTFEMGPGKLQFARDTHENSLHWAWREWACEHLHELQGKNLACWCPLDQPCHADVLLELANGEVA
jgi:hypothetical protein